MQAVLEIVLPVFGLILCGYGFGKGGLLPAGAGRGIAAFVFNLAIPALLFRSMAKGLPVDGVSWGLVATYFAGCAAMFALAAILGRFVFGLAADQCVVLAMGAAFSNIVMLGLPLAALRYGHSGLVLTVLLIAFHSPVLIGGTTLAMEILRGRGDAAGRVLATTILALARNPILVGLFAGAAWGVTGVDLPTPIARVVDLLAGAAAPAALFALGASMIEFRVAGERDESLTLVGLKLIVHPIVTWGLARFVFELPELQVQVAVLCAALPIGANVFLLAQRYEVYVRRSATGVLLSTALSLATIAVLLGLGG